MSKIYWLSAVLLIAFVLCLTACGEDKGTDADATPIDATTVQSATVQPTSPAQAPSAAATVMQDSTVGSVKESVAATQPQSAGGDNAADHSADAQKSGSGASVSNDSGAGRSQTDERPAADRVTSQNTDQPDPDPDVILPRSTEAKGSRDRDNAEVSINDL